MKISFRLSTYPLGAVLLGCLTLSSVAQNSNPTGNAGRFNALSTTGGSYDPYSMNATRTIPELTVTGAVGDYPLQWSRTMNSRSAYGSYDLGAGGGWTHSYYWYMSPSEIFSGQTPGMPSSYTVSFPVGSVETFPYDSASGTCSPAFLGIRERFLPLNPTTLLAYLVLPDGGQVEFKATKQIYADYDDSTNPPTITYTSWYTYQAQAIIDPAGLRTTLTYNTSGQLTKVAEPAGRWLKIYYNTSGTYVGLINHVDAGYDVSTVTQEVIYGYSVFTSGTKSYKTLTSASYSDSTSATYTYQNSNVYPFDGNPLILQCNDVRYPGPMKNIAYEFLFSGYNIYGQLYREKHPNGTAVVTVTMTGNSRTETRGDGKTRKFTYNAAIATNPVQYRQYLLASQTDFFPTTTHPATTFTYGAYGHLTSVTDPNGHKTSLTHIAGTGAVLSVTHPTVTGEGTATINYEYEDPTTGYYLSKVTDELGNSTTYHHDDASQGTMRTTSIVYADLSSESFTYDTYGFNQVTFHTRRTGGVEQYVYDSRGRLTKFIPPATPLDGDPNPSANPTIYGYDADDHVHTIQDPKTNTTTINYNDRGQVTSIVNPDADLSKTVNTYNPDGTLWTVKVDYALNTGATTTYTYDDYKRLTTVKTPQRFTGDSTPRVTNYYYDNAGGAVDDYTHTDSNVTRIVSPGGIVTRNVYDNNHWLLNTTVGYGSGEAATTGFTYDNVGNVLTKTEPKYYYVNPPPQWVYLYDARDRVQSINDPLGNPTSYTYDKASNKKTEVRPNGQTTTYNTYDGMNRLTQMTVQRTDTVSDVTHYTWTAAGNMASMTDPLQKLYQYTYDYLDRLRQVTYPLDNTGVARTEEYTYDISSNKATFKNRAGWVQTFTYDSRNRETRYDWNDGTTPSRTLSYDDASNILTCWVPSANIVFSYYNDFKLKSETETISNYSDNTARTVTYTYDADGRRATIQYPSGQMFKYDYSGRGQLANIYDQTAPGTPVQASYTHDLNGNRTARYLNGKTTFDDPNFTTYDYDENNRLNWAHHYLNTANTFWSHVFNYAYDAVGNRVYEMRDWQSKGDGFQYNKASYVTGYQREGTVNTGDGTVSNPTNDDTLSYDASGNRVTTSDKVNGVTTTINYSVNDLNQYSAVGSKTPGYGNNANLTSYDGWTFGYDSLNQLTSAVKGSTAAYFWYDGLGRICTRQINGGAGVRFQVWAGWDMVEDYTYPSHALGSVYLQGEGTDEMVSITTGGQKYYLYQDGRGNVSEVADANAMAVETYKYDLHGKPTIYDPSGVEVTSGVSTIGNRFLFTGREYYRELGLYNLRHRFYMPELGRFLQPDPIGFAGDPANLYRYCGNNPANLRDPMGTQQLGPFPPASGGQFHLPPGYTGTPADAFIGNYMPENNPVSNLGHAYLITVPALALGVMGGPLATEGAAAVFNLRTAGWITLTIYGTVVNFNEAEMPDDEMPPAGTQPLPPPPPPVPASADSGKKSNTDADAGDPILVYAPRVANYGPAGLAIPTGGVLGPGGLAAIGPDAVYGSVVSPGNVFFFGNPFGSAVDSGLLHAQP
jgi:RHS repeat-associated protein